MKKKLAFFVALFMLIALSASAATFEVGDVYEYKGNVINDDVYIAGGAVDVSGNINGDGILVGGEISVLGNITQDVAVAGGSVRLLGSIGDDARAIGGDITVANRIGGDLVAAGGFIRILSDSIIRGDTVIAGGAVVMNGTIAGDLTIYGEEVEINGPVNGDVTLKFTKKVTIGEDAVIGGSLTYSATEEVIIPEGAFVGGEVTRVESPVKDLGFDKKDVGKFLGFMFLVKLILMLVTGVIAVLVFKKLSKTIGTRTQENFWKNALIGFITIIVVPVAAILLLITVFGAYIGLFLIGLLTLTLFVAHVYAGIVAGAFLSKWIKKEAIVDWKWAILGIVVLHAISLIPVLGGFVCFVFVLATFGTLGALAHKNFWLNR